MKAAELRVDRRRFLLTCAACAASGSLVGCASVVARAVPLRDGVAVVALQDFPELGKPGEVARVLPAGFGDPLYVVAEGEGKYLALSSRCTHRGCTIDFEGDGFACPCHGSGFDRSGAVTKGPASQPLRRYLVRAAGNVLEIQLERIES